MSLALPRSHPTEQGTDPAAVLAFVDAMDADPATEVHSLMVVRHGHVVAEGSWAPHTPERTRQLYSLSKSFTSTALGLAVAEGLLDLDDTVVSHLPELAEEVTDPRSRAITLRHLASMASGHDREMWDEAVRRDPREPVRGFLTVPPDAAPGTLFAYSQPCTYALASVIQRAAGVSLTQYLRPRLFDPLGIGEVGWRTWPAGSGREQGFSGLFARIEDVAKLGVLYLRRGRWGDTQLVPSSYVDQATSRQIATADGGSPDWSQGYGLGFWRSRHGYRGDGAFGQFCVVLPDHDVVVAITSGTASMQAVLDHLWTQLLPGLSGASAPKSGQPELRARLQSLALPPCAARPRPPRWEDWTDTSFPVAPGATASLTSVGLQRTDERLDVTITETANALTLSVGATGWLTTAPRDLHGSRIPVATSGGWLDDDTLRVEVVFVESPHRMDLTCTLSTGTATATWRDVPLDGGALETLHRPR